jgi:gag-polyprotein putative aspartyl protease
VKIGIRHWNSGAGETRRYNRCSSLQLSVAVGMVALLFCIRGPLCFGSPSPGLATANTEVPFELYNDNLIIVRATIAAIMNVNMILDTGTSPSAISKEMADRLKVRGKTETLQTLNGPIQAQSIILPHIQIGTLRGDSIRVVVQDLSFMERSLGISLGGIAGLVPAALRLITGGERSFLELSQQVQSRSVLTHKYRSSQLWRKSKGKRSGCWSIRGPGDCSSTAIAFGQRSVNSNSIRMLRYQPLAG